jgi:uncharacterized protein (DUF1810 family)
VDDDPFKLRRFVDAQQGAFKQALAELDAGVKRTHWMWFIFPQLAGLGSSPAAQFYAIASLEEARSYLAHPLLGPRLKECVEAILPWAGRRTAVQILGTVDALKLRSSMTLFGEIEPAGPFVAALRAFYGGEPDQRTLALLNSPR